MNSIRTLCTAAILAFFAASAVPSQAQIPTPTVLYHFRNTTDAIIPTGSIAQGRDGNIYGVSQTGGANGHGGIWVITPTGIETLLLSFTPSFGGCNGLALATDGNFYGTCSNGGANNFGLVFKVTPAGVLTDLHDFTHAVGDAFPTGAPSQGADGNFYGTTGVLNFNCGNIYRLTPTGAYKNLHTFPTRTSDCFPSTVVFASDGSFYGTVANSALAGTKGATFKSTTAGGYKIVASFADVTGSMPRSGVIQASDGKLYGTTIFGAANNAGAIYNRPLTGGAFTDLHSLKPATDGDGSMNDLLQATNGNFYGASFGGGTGDGSLYELTSAGVFSAFLLTGNTTGAQPASALIQHTNGTIYGTTSASGGFSFSGTFFSLNIGAAPFVSVVNLSGGKIGTQVGILGQGFTGSSVVKFGGVAATTVSFTGNTFALATIPAGAHTGSVTVTTGASTLTSNKMFNVTPAIASFTPAAGHPGSPVVITGSGLIQATKVTFGGVAATAFTVNTDSQVTATVPATGKTGKIGITTPGGVANSMKTFTVN